MAKQLNLPFRKEPDYGKERTCALCGDKFIFDKQENFHLTGRCKKWYCIVCGANEVFPWDGDDTCSECLSKA